MAIKKVQLPSGSSYDIHDARIAGIDSTPTANSTNLVTSGGVKSYVDGALSEALTTSEIDTIWNSAT